MSIKQEPKLGVAKPMTVPESSQPGAAQAVSLKSQTVVVAALYRFAPLPDYAERQKELAKLACSQGVQGTLLLASEGINGTIAGSRQGIDRVLAHVRDFPGFADLEVKESAALENPFTRLKVRLKQEIVTMGQPGIDPLKTVGTYIQAEDWNDLIAREDVVVVDTRNDYEVEIGTFEGAVDPKTKTFREFPQWAKDNLKPGSNTKIAMFCTGGIRCEKATAFLKELGHDDVYHLKGGILKYLERIPAAESLWQGECFVFDRRVSVGHGLEPGPLQLCAICRRPVKTEKAGGGYASKPCPDCERDADQAKKDRAASRQKQIELAAARGEQHIGQRKPK
ncbi:MAG: rhodanese-related sulfurtransferase [Pseudomonadota bacterium]